MKTRALLLMTITLIIVSANVFPNTITVTTGNDSISGSLRDAIGKAQNGDTIIFNKTLTEINLGEQITFDKSITISGNPKLVIHDYRIVFDAVSGNSTTKLHRLLEINGSDAITVNIENLKFIKIPEFVGSTVSDDLNGKIILAHNSNSNSTININSCYFTKGSNSGSGGWINYTSKSNGQNGGAIAQGGGILNISDCTFSNLEAGGEIYYGVGGAIYQALGALNLINCTFYDNSPGYQNSGSRKFMGQASAIHSQNSTISITNCTFCENINSTVVGTTSTIDLFSSNLTIKNSIFYNNSGYDFYGSINSGGYNIFDQTTVSGSVTNDIFNCNPGFTLKNNVVVLSDSSFWIPVCALNYNGCAVDALPADGNGAPKYDQRGFIRYNKPDIGAYEFKGTILPILNVSTNSLTLASPANSTATFNITSNISWQINSNQTWLNVSKASGSDTASITLTALGNPNISKRTALVTVSGSGVKTDTITITQASATTAIMDISNSDIQLYPIPVIDKLVISLSKPFSQTSIFIYSLNGLQLYSSKINMSNTEIDMSKYVSGFYFVNIITLNNGILIKKVIKQ